VIGRARHLAEERLFDCYTAAQSGDVFDPRSAAHLAECTDCRARYDELVQFMDGLRQDVDEETAAIFTPEALRTQQQHIMRRIEHLGHPARVLSFPGRVVRRHFARAGGGVAPRWAAAAAAAGLFIGVGVGVVYDSRSRAAAPNPLAMTIARPSRPAAPVVAVAAPTPVADDDAFLSEIETVLGGPHNQELLPFDALTPRVQELLAGLR
jgi:predicted anti-sigma-YlaC factor YlaD